MHADTKYFNMPVNDVTIHTLSYVTLLLVQTVSMYKHISNRRAHHWCDPDTTLNDFTIRISNALHSNRLGYYERILKCL